MDIERPDPDSADSVTPDPNTAPSHEVPSSSLIGRLRRKIGEDRWHGTVAVLLAFLIAAVLLPVLLLIQRDPSEPETVRQPPSAAAGTEQPRQADLGPPQVWAQPTGLIPNHLPDEVVFRVSHTGEYQPERGRILPATAVKDSIRFRPEAPGKVVWLSSNNFAYQFEKPLKPGQRYDFEVRNVPVTENQQVQLEPKAFYFATPEFALLSASLLTWDGPELTAQLEWNLPVRLLGLEEWIAVRDGAGRSVSITSIQSSGDRTVQVLFRHMGSDTYTISAQNGLSSTLTGIQLKEDAQVRLAIPRRELYIQRVTAEESGSGYALNVIGTVQGARECKVDRNVESYLDLAPPVECRVQYHSQGFRVVGDFLPEQSYLVTIRSGLSAGEAVLRQNFVQSVKMPAPSPQVQFAVRGRYLGRHLGIKLPLRTRAAEKLAISIWRLPPENLAWASSNLEYSAYQYGEPVVQQEEITLEAPADGDTKETQLTWLELNEFMDTSEPGVYRVQAERVISDEERRRERRGSGSYHRNTSDNAVVVITDLALISKQSEDKVWVWAVDAKSGEPRPRVSVRLYSQRNVLMGTGATDSSGMCEVAYEAVRDRQPHLLTGTRGDDFTYLAVGPGTLSLSPFSVSGIRTSEVNYRAYFYPERNLYRPGETLHFATLLREESTFEGMSIPVKVSVTDPRGKHITDLMQTTDTTGLAAFDLPLPATTPTGNYSLNVLIGDKSAAYGNIFVETFVPERMSVEVAATMPEVTAGEPIGFAIQADYLFGAPAAEERYRYHLNVHEGRFTSRKSPGFSFGKIRQYGSEPPSAQISGDGVLDATGAAQESAEVDDWSQFYNLAEARISVEVEEAGSGRVSRGWETVKVHPFPYYIGLKANTRRITPGKPLVVNGVTVDHSGELLTQPRAFSYELYEIHHDYVRTWDPGRNRFSWEYTRQRYPIEHSDAVQAADGRFEITVYPSTYWYDYVLEVHDSEGASVSELMIQGWSWYGDDERPESPEILDVQVQSESAGTDHNYGDVLTAEALLPFAGRVLWTVELDDVLQHEWQEASEEISRLKFTVPQGVTTVYVSALLIRSDEQYLVRRAFGVLQVPIRPAKHRLPLQVDVPERVRPGEELTVSLTGSAEMRATVAIVDEGILQITRFQSPDVYEGILRNQALGVRTSESLGWIINKAMAKPGGSEEASLSLETPSMVRLVSYWSGVLKADHNGDLKATFQVPQYLGRLRVMVSAVDEQRMVSAEDSVTVSTEVVVLATPPRFVIKGDQLEFPIALKNTTAQEQQVKLTIAGTTSQMVLPPNGSKIVWQPLEAQALSGTLNINLVADWGANSYSDTLSVPILPDRPFQTDQQYLAVKAGGTDLLPTVAGWLPKYQKTRITLTATPGVSRLHHIKHLVRYPYGCLEQTSSSLLPLVRMKPLLAAAVPDAIGEGELTNKVHAGIARLMSMQTPSGGFAFWPGSGDPAQWASIYATFVLLEARQAGYLVPDTVIDPALDYVERYARAEALGYFVLARGNRLDSSDMDEILDLSKGKLNSEQQVLLAGALHLGGRSTSADMLLTEALRAYETVKTRSYYGNFASPLRNYAVRLYVRELLHPGAPENEADTMALIQMLDKRSYYYSTQELAWSMLALGTRIGNGSYAQNYTATLLLDGQEQEARQTKRGVFWFLESAVSAAELRLQVESDGLLYAIVENSGFRQDANYAPVSENGLEVRKRLLDADGNEVTTFGQRELYFVEVTLTNKRSEGLQNVALEDFIPAGFEVENPRLPGTANREFLRGKPQFSPEYVDYHDERVQAFGYVSSGKTFYFYLLRAVTPGTFTLPPVNAVVMYDPVIEASSGMSQITILR